LFLITSASLICQSIFAQGWAPVGSGFDGQVSALITFKGNVFAGGAFGSSGSTQTGKIAKWNGTAWTVQGPVINNGSVNAFAEFNGELNAAGNFVSGDINRIDRWDGVSWQKLGKGINGDVFALAVYNNELYAAGSFSVAGGKPAKG